MIEDIDCLGREWGKWMRYQPNGWPSKNHITNLKKISFASGNSYAPMAVTVGMYDLIGHFVYLKLYGGFSYEGGRKRNKAQAAGSKPCG